ncbi:hypothetical protein ATANTOWER_018590 [Ataeniobius toweri]|uniref:SWIM-type domain-containing protein n=1 Tax=Ataeniobius toweri TaxID=208326 RepID=A0ABU7C361_9TELE|nr:hypothetical protein [Ataeniobius toweri]
MKKDDRQSESQQVVKIEVEDISLDENQDAMKQETDTLMGKYSGFPEIKEEHGAGHQQMAKKEAGGNSQDKNQDLLKETDTLILMASYDETDNKQPELNRNQIFFQNFPKAEHQEIKTNEASGSSRVERQQKRAQKTRGQSNNVEKGANDKRIHKGVCSCNFAKPAPFGPPVLFLQCEEDVHHNYWHPCFVHEACSPEGFRCSCSNTLAALPSICKHTASAQGPLTFQIATCST